MLLDDREFSQGAIIQGWYKLCKQAYAAAFGSATYRLLEFIKILDSSTLENHELYEWTRMAVAGRVGQLAYQGRSLWHALRAWVAAHPSVACAKGGSVSELTSPPLTWPLTDCLSLKDSRFKYFRNHELYECSRMAAS